MMGNFSWKSHTLIQYVTAYYHRESIFSSPNCDCNLSSWDCLCPLPESQAPKIIFWIVRRPAIQRKRKGRALECFILALSARKRQVFCFGIYVIVLENYSPLNLNMVKSSKYNLITFYICETVMRNNRLVSLLTSACPLTTSEAVLPLAMSLPAFDNLVALSKVNTRVGISQENPDGSEMNMGFKESLVMS